MIVYDSFLKIFYSTSFNGDNYFSGFATKQLGDARKIENIFNFFNKNKISYKKIVVAEQIHSSNIKEIGFSNKGNFEKVEDTDGLLTKEKNIVLIVRTADCLPIIYVEKNQGIIAISHNGWRGTIKKISYKIIEKMVELGANISFIKVAIGPGIGQCCYSIDEDRYYQFKDEFDGYSDKIFRWYKGKWHLNLLLLNYLLLLDYGVKKENIDYFPFCTSCDGKRFFSFRKDNKKDYGEMSSFIERI